MGRFLAIGKDGEAMAYIIGVGKSLISDAYYSEETLYDALDRDIFDQIPVSILHPAAEGELDEENIIGRTKNAKFYDIAFGYPAGICVDIQVKPEYLVKVKRLTLGQHRLGFHAEGHTIVQEGTHLVSEIIKVHSIGVRVPHDGTYEKTDIELIGTAAASGEDLPGPL